MLVRLIREGLGRVIVFGDWLSRPKPKERNEKERAALASDAAGLSLYQFYACPFCVKVRRAIHALNVPIEIRDAQNDQEHRKALENGGGRVKVPCLRIDTDDGSQWLYESNEIIDYLTKRFG